ncbi:Calcium-binding ef-hand, partial [Thalictrum thalictroides]
MKQLTLFMLVLCLVVNIGYSRLNMSTNSSSGSDLASDGLTNVHQSPYLLLGPINSSVTCEPMDGFLPCATNIWGHLFLIVVYQYLLYLGDRYVSTGSELMFSLVGPGIFGASAFQILGSLPEALLVLASGISGSQETAQAEVVSGVGILAGSTVFLLTLLWGTCVVVGKMDLSEELKSFDTGVSKPLSFLESGITTDCQTHYTARIMILSTMPFIIAQLPHVLGSSSAGSVATPFALIMSVTFLFSYCFYQVFQPWIQNRRLDYMRHKFVQNILLPRLHTSDGRPNEEVIKELFHKIDQNNDKFVTPGELKGLILGIQFQEVGLNEEDFVEMVLKDFDTSSDAQIDEKEFVRGISKWLSNTNRKNDNKSFPQSAQEFTEEQDTLIAEVNKNVQGFSNIFWSYLKAASLLFLGISILVLLARPLIKTVVNFSSAANIPSIYVSFIMVPMVVNYRRAISSVKSIQQKRQQSASLTLSEIYSGAFMNNIFGISTLLGIVYARGLEWNFSAQEPLPQFCEMTYGFLPCTTTVLGNLFLIVVYGFLMFLAARYLSTASELLLEILGPGLVGGLFLPMLGSLPDSLLILVSGLSGSQETAQSQVLVGMGLLAGSAVVLLTLLWGSCVVVGKTDIVGSTTIDLQDTKGFTST